MLTELISRWPDEYSFTPLLVVGLSLIAAAVPVAIVASVQWRKVRQAELDFHLKQEMLARGFALEQIESVLRASPEPGERGASAPWSNV